MIFQRCNVGNHVTEFGYERKSRLMGVKFSNGDTYYYEDVSPDIFELFLASPSPGRFVGRVIAKLCNGKKA